MGVVNIRRVLAGEEGGVVKDLLGSLGNHVSVRSPDGKIVIGSDNAQENERVPVVFGGEILGYVSGREGLDAVASLIRLLATRYQERRELARETLEKYREIHLLYRMSERISECLGLDDVALLVLEEARNNIAACCGSVMLLNSNSGSLEVVAGFGKEQPHKTTFRPGEGIAGSVLLSGKAELLNHARLDSRFKPGPGPHALICTPLRGKNRIHGVINISHDIGVEYAAADLQLLKLLASQAASAIENVLLHERRVRQERIRGNLERYVPSQVVNLILEEPNDISLASENRHVAVLFADIRGFSSTCESLAPERVVAYLNMYFTAMVDEIFQHKGTVNKFVGDMIVALFGAPVKMDRPERGAVRAAVAMQRRMRSMKEPWIRAHFHTGMGVSAGMAVVGNIGSPRHMDYTAIGDEVNVAARLQSMARGGQVLVSRAVYEVSKDLFAFRPVGLVRVKGRKRPVETYEVVYS